MLIHNIPTNQIAYRRAAHVERFRRLKLRALRKIEHAEEKRVRTLQTELTKSLRKGLDRKKLQQSALDLREVIDKLGITEGITHTNQRGIQRKLAQELSKLPEHNEFPEFSGMIDKLKS